MRFLFLWLIGQCASNSLHDSSFEKLDGKVRAINRHYLEYQDLLSETTGAVSLEYVIEKEYFKATVKRYIIFVVRS